MGRDFNYTHRSIIYIRIQYTSHYLLRNAINFTRSMTNRFCIIYVDYVRPVSIWYKKKIYYSNLNHRIDIIVVS